MERSPRAPEPSNDPESSGAGGSCMTSAESSSTGCSSCTLRMKSWRATIHWRGYSSSPSNQRRRQARARPGATSYLLRRAGSPRRAGARAIGSLAFDATRSASTALARLWRRAKCRVKLRHQCTANDADASSAGSALGPTNTRCSPRASSQPFGPQWRRSRAGTESSTGFDSPGSSRTRANAFSSLGGGACERPSVAGEAT